MPPVEPGARIPTRSAPLMGKIGKDCPAFVGAQMVYCKRFVKKTGETLRQNVDIINVSMQATVHANRPALVGLRALRGWRGVTLGRTLAPDDQATAQAVELDDPVVSVAVDPPSAKSRTAFS